MKRGFLLKAQEKEARRDSQKKTRADKDSTVASVTKAMDGVSIEGQKMEESSPVKGPLPFSPGSDGNIQMPLSRMPYGKISEADKLTPEEKTKYARRTGLLNKECSAATVDYPEGMISMTTIPPMIIGSDGDPDGHTEWLFRGSTKAKVLNAPGYPASVPKPRRRGMYEVKKTEDMGYGVFATCDIQQGELIFAERPLIVAPTAVGSSMHQIKELGDMSEAKRLQLIMADWEEALQLTVNRLPEHKKKAFMALQNSHTGDGSPPILGIKRTNAYGIGDTLYDGPKAKHDKSNKYSAVCEIGSRINHSCIPNISHNFSLSSFSMQFFATCAIKKGEQLFFSYCEPLKSVATRRAELIRYDVICKCFACENATPRSDKFREDFADLTKNAVAKIHSIVRGERGGWKITQTDVDNMVELQQRAEKENISLCCVEYMTFIVALSIACKEVGKPQDAKRFYSKVERLPFVKGDHSFSR